MGVCVQQLEGVRRISLDARSSGQSVLCITGPIDDGFWTRALVVLYQADWARTRGLPFVVFHNSSDAFNGVGGGANSWEQYFEPLTHGCLPACLDAPPVPTVQLDACAAKQLWRDYARSYEPVSYTHLTLPTKA